MAEPGGAADVSHLRAERQRSRMRLSSIARLEQVQDLPSHHAPAAAVPDVLARMMRCLVFPSRSGCTEGQPTQHQRRSWHMMRMS